MAMHATKANDWAFDYLPKLERRHSWTEIWDDMYERPRSRACSPFGMNGVQIGPELREEHRRAEEGRLAGGRRNLSRTRRASSGGRPAPRQRR